MALGKKINFGGTFSGGIPVSKKKAKEIVYGNGKPDIETDSITELTELQKEFKEAAKKEEQLKADNTNANFFSVLVFKTQEQRDQFYTMLGIKADDMQYIDGQKLIKALDLKIQNIELKNPGKFKCNTEIANLALG